MKTFLVFVMLAAGVNAGGPPGRSGSTDELFASYGFPPAPGVTHLCGEHVMGSSMEITWDAFASNKPVRELVAFYREKLGKDGMESDRRGATWRLPVGAKRPERVLTVSASTDEGPHRRCGGEALKKARSVVLVSKSTDKRPGGGFGECEN